MLISKGNDYKRRSKIIADLLPLEFRVIVFVANKQAFINHSPLTSYKKVFIKYFHQRLCNVLYHVYPKLKIVEDQTGTSEFQAGFKKYVENNRPQNSLFNEYDFDFKDSKDSVLVQLADIIGGTITKCYTDSAAPNYLVSPMLHRKRLYIMKLREIMSSNIVTLTPEQTIRDACKIFLEQHIDGAPVVNEKNEILGLFTKSHIYRSVCNDKNSGTLVGEVMKQEIIVGHPDEQVEILIKGNIGRLPVVDENGIAGMITRTDLARAYFDSYNINFNKNQAILNSTYNLIVSIDKNGKIECFNRAAEKFLGLKAEKVRGRDIMEIFPDSGLIEIFETGSTKLVQKIKLNNHMFISNRSPIKEGKKIIGAVAVLQDISELESISRELENVKELYNELDAIIESSYDGLYLTDGEELLYGSMKPLKNLPVRKVANW